MILILQESGQVEQGSTKIDLFNLGLQKRLDTNQRIELLEQFIIETSFLCFSISTSPVRCVHNAWIIICYNKLVSKATNDKEELITTFGPIFGIFDLYDISPKHEPGKSMAPGSLLEFQLDSPAALWESNKNTNIMNRQLSSDYKQLCVFCTG